MTLADKARSYAIVLMAACLLAGEAAALLPPESILLVRRDRLEFDTPVPDLTSSGVTLTSAELESRLGSAPTLPDQILLWHANSDTVRTLGVGVSRDFEIVPDFGAALFHAQGASTWQENPQVSRGDVIARVQAGDVVVLNVMLFDPSVPTGDSDGDGISDVFELANGFDPADPDEDSNGTLDGDDDADEDGLTNALEEFYATNPNSDQSDVDDLSDGIEVAVFRTDPALRDTDGDGVDDDLDNCRLMSNSGQADFDGDGRGDVCDDLNPVDLADPTTREVIVQFEMSTPLDVTGRAFDDHQLRGTYSEVLGNREIVVPFQGFRDFIERTNPTNPFAWGVPGDLTFTIDPTSGDMTFSQWGDPGIGLLASANTTIASGGAILRTLYGIPDTAVFCDASLHGPCDIPVSTSVYDPQTGEINGIGGIQDFFGPVDPPDDRWNPYADVRFAELPENAAVIDFEGVAAAGNVLEVTPDYLEDGYLLDGAFGSDPNVTVTSATAPGITLTGTDFGHVEADAEAVLTESSGKPFTLHAVSFARTGGATLPTITVRGSHVLGPPSIETFTPAANDWATLTLPPDWTELTSVRFTTDQADLAIDDIEVSTVERVGDCSILRWRFDHAAGASAADGVNIPESACGEDAHVRGAGASFNGTGIDLPGGSGTSGAAYVDLPNGLVSSLDSATIEIWYTMDAAQWWGRLFDFGNSGGNEVPPGPAGGNRLYLGYRPQQGWNADLQDVSMGIGPGSASASIQMNELTTLGTRYHLVVTYERDGVSSGVHQISAYRNGIRVGQTSITSSLSDLDDVNSWLGRSNSDNEWNFDGQIDEFRIYDRALTWGEVAYSRLQGPDTPVVVVPEPGFGLGLWAAAGLLAAVVRTRRVRSAGHARSLAMAATRS